MDAGLQGDFLDMMAALAPCVMGYGEIGLRLKADMTADTPYKEWINTYADTEYQDFCTSVGKMIDAAIDRRLGDISASPRAKVLQDRFTMATQLEVGFWQMGING
jgi:thiaminase/transcriptional activator TenA